MTVTVGKEIAASPLSYRVTDIDFVGDLLLIGAGKGLTYGEIYVAGNTAETVISLSGKANRVKVTVFDTNGPSNNVTPDQANNQITIDKAGVYFVTCCIHADSATGGSAEFGWSIYKNGSTEIENLHSHRDFAAGGGGEAGAANICGLADLDATDILTLYCWNVGGTQNVVNADTGISVVQIGGT